jgi:hypothetical protein
MMTSISLCVSVFFSRRRRNHVLISYHQERKKKRVRINVLVIKKKHFIYSGIIHEEEILLSVK